MVGDETYRRVASRIACLDSSPQMMVALAFFRVAVAELEDHIGVRIASYQERK